MQSENITLQTKLYTPLSEDGKAQFRMTESRETCRGKNWLQMRRGRMAAADRRKTYIRGIRCHYPISRIFLYINGGRALVNKTLTVVLLNSV